METLIFLCVYRKMQYQQIELMRNDSTTFRFWVEKTKNKQKNSGRLYQFTKAITQLISICLKSVSFTFENTPPKMQ